MDPASIDMVTINTMLQDINNEKATIESSTMRFLLEQSIKNHPRSFIMHSEILHSIINNTLKIMKEDISNEWGEKIEKKKTSSKGIRTSQRLEYPKDITSNSILSDSKKYQFLAKTKILVKNCQNTFKSVLSEELKRLRYVPGSYDNVIIGHSEHYHHCFFHQITSLNHPIFFHHDRYNQGKKICGSFQKKHKLPLSISDLLKNTWLDATMSLDGTSISRSSSTSEFQVISVHHPFYQSDLYSCGKLSLRDQFSIIESGAVNPPSNDIYVEDNDEQTSINLINHYHFEQKAIDLNNFRTKLIQYALGIVSESDIGHLLNPDVMQHVLIREGISNHNASVHNLDEYDVIDSDDHQLSGHTQTNNVQDVIHTIKTNYSTEIYCLFSRAQNIYCSSTYLITLNIIKLCFLLAEIKHIIPNNGPLVIQQFAACIFQNEYDDYQWTKVIAPLVFICLLIY
jgi:hypothetical protein